MKAEFKDMLFTLTRFFFADIADEFPQVAIVAFIPSFHGRLIVQLLEPIHRALVVYKDFAPGVVLDLHCQADHRP